MSDTPRGAGEGEPGEGRAGKPAPRGWKPVLRVALGVAISAVALVAVLRKVDWGLVTGAWHAADVRWLLVAALIYPWRLAVVAVRWGELLRLYGPVPSFGLRLRATSIGYLFNNLLPLRSGDVIRGGLAVHEGVSLRAAATSLVLEKMLDLWALVAIVLVAGGAFLQAEPALLRSLHVLAVAAVASLAAFLTVALACSAETAQRWCDRAASRPARLAARLARIIVESGQLCRRPRSLLITLAATAVNWAIEGSFYLLVAHALGMPLAGAGALFLVSVIGLGLTVPTTAGGIGLIQYLVVTVLKVEGVDVNLAVAYSLLSYAVGFLSVNGVGVGFLIAESLRRRAAASAWDGSPSAWGGLSSPPSGAPPLGEGGLESDFLESPPHGEGP